MSEFKYKGLTLEGWLVGGPLDRSVNWTAAAIGRCISLLDSVYLASLGDTQVRASGDSSFFTPQNQEESVLEIIFGVKEIAAEKAKRLGGAARQLWDGTTAAY